MSLPFDPSYTPPATANKGYFKPGKEKSKIRVMGEGITGYIVRDRTGDKPRPVRAKEETNEMRKLKGDNNPIKHFWALTVYDFQDKSIKIREITQRGIMDSIQSLCSQEDWGDIRNYSLNVYKEGEKMETKYFLTPVPDKGKNKEADDCFAKSNVNLEALLHGDDPFSTSTHDRTDDLSF